MENKLTDPGTVPHFHTRAYDGYYKANAKGTGSALKIELCPAFEDTAGCIYMKVARQRTIGSVQAGQKIFPTFDWQNAITLKLDRTDLSQLLQVLRGMQESIFDDKGLYHRSATGSTVIRFAHQIEPRPGYVLSVWRKSETGEGIKAYYVFDMSEAFTLMLSLERALLYVCFGIPEHIVRPPLRTGVGPSAAAGTQPVPSDDTPALAVND